MYFDAAEDDSGGSDLDGEAGAEIEATTMIGVDHLNMEGGHQARVGRVAGRHQDRAAAPRAPVLLYFGFSAKRVLTYNIFVEKVWPKMNSVKQFPFHPYVHFLARPSMWRFAMLLLVHPPHSPCCPFYQVSGVDGDPVLLKGQRGGVGLTRRHPAIGGLPSPGQEAE